MLKAQKISDLTINFFGKLYCIVQWLCTQFVYQSLYEIRRPSFTIPCFGWEEGVGGLANLYFFCEINIWCFWKFRVLQQIMSQEDWFSKIGLVKFHVHHTYVMIQYWSAGDTAMYGSYRYVANVCPITHLGQKPQFYLEHAFCLDWLFNPLSPGGSPCEE